MKKQHAKSISSKTIALVFAVAVMVSVVSMQTLNVAFNSKVQAAPVSDVPAAGAVNNWFSLTGATRLSIDITPKNGETGYHYYSLSPFFDNQSYGMYSGIQTNGYLNGAWVGNMAIFSVWNATVAYPAAGVTATPFDGEGIGYSLRKPYAWNVNDTYTVTLSRTTFDTQANGWRWKSTITHKQDGQVTTLGEIVAPTGADTLATGSVFHERFSGNSITCTSRSTSITDKAGALFTKLSADKPVSFYYQPDPNGVFTSTKCASYLQKANVINGTSAATGFGIDSRAFGKYWPAR